MEHTRLSEYPNIHSGADEPLHCPSNLIPEGRIDALATSDTCQFCRGEQLPRAYYALLDMAHAEPIHEKPIVLGTKTAITRGSYAPVQIACCKRCRKNMLMLQYWPVLLPLIVGILALLAFGLTPWHETLMQYGAFMPFAAFVLVVLVGLLLGQLSASWIYSVLNKQTHLNPLTIPTVGHMVQLGWFPLEKTHYGAKVVFLKKRM